MLIPARQTIHVLCGSVMCTVALCSTALTSAQEPAPQQEAGELQGEAVVPPESEADSLVDQPMPIEPTVAPATDVAKESVGLGVPEPPSDAEIEAMLAEEAQQSARPSVNRDTMRVRFSFNGARWREVLDWLAEQADLALHVDQLPPGTFTYSDDASFGLDEAISRLNLFMVPEGYAAVRSGTLLTVINLGDPRSLQQLDALAKVVRPDELTGFGDHEVVKCFLPLGDLQSEEVIAELQPLSLMTSPVSLPRSNQLIITETAGKLRNVLQVIDAIEPPADEQMAVKRFVLEHADAETVLMVARAHLGIPEGDTMGLDITVTPDPSGKRLYAIGNPEKVDTLEKLVGVLDVDETPTDTTEPAVLVSHPVRGDDLQAVYDVLQTVLAGQSIRLSAQESTRSIVAYAPPAVQDVIARTVDEISAPSVDALEFAVIELNGTDPYFAVALIDQLFGEEEDSGWSRRRWWEDNDDDDESGAKAPKVDADVAGGRLFVRGTAAQIEQIENLVARMSERPARIGQGTMRMVPVAGPQGEQILRAAQRRWSSANPIRLEGIYQGATDNVIERVLHPEDDDRATEVPTNASAAIPNDIAGEQATTLASSDAGATPVVAPPIDTQLVPGGIVLQSEDTDALDRFEMQLKDLATRAEQSISPPVIYYLKYVKAEEAVKMLADLLDGGYSLTETSSDGLVNGYASESSSTYYGSLLYSREGQTTVTAGTATIVSDARLNRLIVQGTAADMAVIDRYMKIIDQESSRTAIETSGTTHVVELMHCDATEVAEVIRQAFPNRIMSSDPRGGAGARRGGDPRAGGGRDEDRDRRDDNDRDRDQRQPPQDKPTRGQEAMMAVAVHAPSNSLIITAPEFLFNEVKKLIDSVDQKSEQVVSVIPAGPGVNVESLLEALGSEVPDSRGSRDDRRRSERSRRDR